MSPMVNTVRGPVDVDRLGPTLMHEHIFTLNMEVMINHPEIWDEELRVDDAVQKLNELKASGTDTIVDPTVMGLGRYIPRIQRVCAQTDLNVIVATGFYTYNELPFWFHNRGPGTLLGGPEPLVEMFVSDIEEGISGTGVKAGVLKFATDHHGMTRDCERIIRACAVAHRRTGVPITTHSNAHNGSGLEQQRILQEEGVDLSRVVIGHSGDTTDVAYLEKLIANGSYIGMDRFGLDVYLPTAERVDTIVELCRRGHADRMVLAHDASCWIDWVQPAPDEVRQAIAPNWHYLHIANDVIPMLLEKGISQDDVDQMMVRNPRDYFARQGGY